jgi:hypothetical protein
MHTFLIRRHSEQNAGKCWLTCVKARERNLTQKFFFQSCGSEFCDSGSGVLMTKNARKKIQLKILLSFCDQKLQLLLKASINDVQATEEAFSSQKRTSRTTKNENYYLFFYFCPPVSGSRDTNYPDPIRIRIHNTAFFYLICSIYDFRYGT